VVAVGFDVLSHQLDWEEDVVEYGTPREQHRVLKDDPGGALRPYDRAALNANRAARRLNESGHHQH